jgi:hypothetical protein
MSVVGYTSILCSSFPRSGLILNDASGRLAQSPNRFESQLYKSCAF